MTRRPRSSPRRPGSRRAGARAVLHGVTSRFAPGEALALVGPNAAGKSTLVRALAGLLRARRGRGAAATGGRSATGRATPRARRRARDLGGGGPGHARPWRTASPSAAIPTAGRSARSTAADRDAVGRALRPDRHRAPRRRRAGHALRRRAAARDPGPGPGPGAAGAAPRRARGPPRHRPSAPALPRPRRGARRGVAVLAVVHDLQRAAAWAGPDGAAGGRTRRRRGRPRRPCWPAAACARAFEVAIRGHAVPGPAPSSLYASRSAREDRLPAARRHRDRLRAGPARRTWWAARTSATSRRTWALPALTRARVDSSLPSAELDARGPADRGRSACPSTCSTRRGWPRLAPDVVVTQAACEVCAISYDQVVARCAAPRLARASSRCSRRASTTSSRDVRTVAEACGVAARGAARGRGPAAEAGRASRRRPRAAAARGGGRVARAAHARRPLGAGRDRGRGRRGRGPAPGRPRPTRRGTRSARCGPTRWWWRPAASTSSAPCARPRPWRRPCASPRAARPAHGRQRLPEPAGAAARGRGGDHGRLAPGRGGP